MRFESGSGKINQRSSEDLKDVELADVLTLWRGKLAASASSNGQNGNGKDGGKVPVESLVAELLLDGGEEKLADLAEQISVLTDQAENNQTVGDDEPLVQTIQRRGQFSCGCP
jgi:hypothetical protein